jgi:hypothetical protein
MDFIGVEYAKIPRGRRTNFQDHYNPSRRRPRPRLGKKFEDEDEKENEKNAAFCGIKSNST